MTKEFNLGKFLQLVLLVLGIFVSGRSEAAEQPNIVFILADDLGSYDVGWRGSEIKTPNLDKLANAGAKLNQFYVQPVCTPTRAALMTGRYPMRYGLQIFVIHPWSLYGLSLSERTLPQALREAGYTTAMCGKWHLGSFDRDYWPNARGFDYWYGNLHGALDYFTHERDGKKDWYRDGVVNLDRGYSTHLLAKEAVARIKSQPKDKPLFLYVPFNSPHGPFLVPDSYKQPYLHLPEPRRTYAGMVAALDEAVGRIVNAIDETGRRKNTLFIFSTDNGGLQPGFLSSNGFLRGGKGKLYEGGIQACAFATWPGHIKAGSEMNGLAHMVDWYPTLLKLAGASLDQPLPLDGVDLWPSLTQGKPSSRREMLCNTTPQNGAIRLGSWKLVINGSSPSYNTNTTMDLSENDQAIMAEAAALQSVPPKLELFDLKLDPYEKTNLATVYPAKLRQLRVRYNQLAAEAAPPHNPDN